MRVDGFAWALALVLSPGVPVLCAGTAGSARTGAAGLAGAGLAATGFFACFVTAAGGRVAVGLPAETAVVVGFWPAAAGAGGLRAGGGTGALRTWVGGTLPLDVAGCCLLVVEARFGVAIVCAMYPACVEGEAET